MTNPDSSAEATEMSVTMRIHALVETLAVSLASWSQRDDSKPQPEIRDAANEAVGAIDKLLRQLSEIRQQLVGEIRESDDATAARIDALLLRGTASGRSS